jgi:hypothetical protein
MGKNKKNKKKKVPKAEVPEAVYPDTVKECIDDKLKFRKATLNAVNEFKRMHPWRGTNRERRSKLIYLHRHLCEIYGIDIGITFDPQGISQYLPEENIIVLNNYSVVTFLHEFAHAMGRDEKGACRWSLNLFKRCFPKSFEKNHKVGHMLIKKKNLPVKKQVTTVIKGALAAANALIEKAKPLK